MAEKPQGNRNAGLETLLEQARWSRTQLANAVNRMGAQVGMTLSNDHSAVSHWLTGTQPGEQVRRIIIEVLERKIGRPLTYAEACLQPPKRSKDTHSGDTVEVFLDLGRADMDPSRRNVMTAGMYAAAVAVPLFSGEAHAEEWERATKPTGHIGPGEVATVRTMTDRIADILDELGGGRARPMAAAFLVNTVAPYLRAQATEAVRNDMLSAASDLTYLTGWMAVYERQHGLGQRYYVKALQLATAAGDHVTYCRTLRGMSLQASSLRHGRTALKLADSADELRLQTPPPTARVPRALRPRRRHSIATLKMLTVLETPLALGSTMAPRSPHSGGVHNERRSGRSCSHGRRECACRARQRPALVGDG